MKNRKLIAFIIASYSGFAAIYAQNVEPFSYNTEFSPSVETYSITKYGTIMPSLYTGAMTYSVLLDTYKDEDFELPITLEYSFDGYRPSAHSGSIGYGWALNYSGAITREIYGYPDDMAGNDNEDKFEGYYKTISDGILNKLGGEYELASGTIAGSGFCGENVSSRSAINVFADCPSYRSVPTVGSNSTRQYDTNPDIFHFNFLGHSGDFMMTEDGSMEVFNSSIPNGEISIAYDFTKRGEFPESEITITTGEGYRYIFGGDYKSMEYNIPSTTESYATVVAWRLRKIEAPNGNYVEFIHNSLLSHDIKITSAYTPIIEPDYSDEFYRYRQTEEITTAVNSLYPIIEKICINGNTIYEFITGQHLYNENESTCFLDEKNAIQSFGHSLHYSAFPRAVRSVKIWNNDGDLIDTIEFGQEHVGYTSPRMMLKYINTSDGKFSFEYESLSPPVNDTKGIDHWGFWNGNSSMEGIPYLLTASYSNLYDQMNSNVKEPSFNHAKQGGLKKIIYPTGGYSTIEYESNEATKLIDKSFGYCPDLCNASNLSTPVLIGGVRVKSISSTFDDMTNTVTYTYQTAKGSGVSSGILLKMPLYSLRANYILKVTGLSTSELKVSAIAFTDECSSNLPNDPFITYSKVQECLPDGSYTEYSFANYVNKYDWYDNSLNSCTFHKKTFSYENDVIRCDDGDEEYPDRLRKTLLPRHKDFSRCRGKLIQKSEYDNGGVLKRATVHSYSDILECERQMFHNSIIDYTEIPLLIYSPRLSRTSEYIYEDGRTIATHTDYGYNSKGQVSDINITNGSTSNGLHYRYHDDVYNNTNPVLKSAIVNVVRTKSYAGNQYILSNSQYQYDTSNGNSKPTKLLQYDCNIPIICNTMAAIYDIPEGYYKRTYDYQYDTDKYRLIRCSDSSGGYTIYTWDDEYRHILSKTVNDPSNVYYYEWKDQVGLVKITEPTAEYKFYEYDSKNRLSGEKDLNESYVRKYFYHLNNE